MNKLVASPSPPSNGDEGRSAVPSPVRAPVTDFNNPDNYEFCNNVYGGAPMSMVMCFDCDARVDSDDDPDCFVEVGNMRRLHQTMVLCENCRGRRKDQIEYEMSIAS